ncbi:UNVERIFIED_CONTAM: hypothetical protein Sradi_6891000, partial [Sesamum radiatum]
VTARTHHRENGRVRHGFWQKGAFHIFRGTISPFKSLQSWSNEQIGFQHIEFE